MITIACPWCEESALLPLPQPEVTEAPFTCLECGTTIDWVEEPLVLDVAA